MIQHQHWEDSTHILITDEQHHGSIQVFIPKRTEDKIGRECLGILQVK